jgi:hypothetical protein
MRVLVVWEPILATDWRAPGTRVLGRIPDRRARQFWDPKHLVAEELARIAKQKPDQPAPECCVRKGFHWDEVALYAPHARWSDAPTPVYWNGPVYRIAPALEKTLQEQP